MRVNLLLPSAGHKITGGFKVVYEYANLFAAAGNDVVVVHPAVTDRQIPFLHRAVKLARYLPRKLRNNWSPTSWFPYFEKRVRLLWVPSLHPRWIPDGDLVMASAWQTAESMQSYGARKGRKIYLVHDYEHYMHADDGLRARILATYGTEARKIVTSPAGAELMRLGGVTNYRTVSNGIDVKTFRVVHGLVERPRGTIAFPWRKEPFKGAADAVEALECVHECFDGALKVWAFGEDAPSGLPSWIEWKNRPTGAQLAFMLNQTSIFLVPSHFEGWGLPGAEAMACGCALVSTDNVGVRAYAENGRNALLVPPCSIGAMAEAMLRLLGDDDVRVRLATEGAADVARLTWANAWHEMEKALVDI